MVFTGAISEGDRVASRSQMETAADRRIMPEIAGRDGNKHMAAMLDDEVADPDRANAELRRRLSEALAERDEAEAQKAAVSEVLEVIKGSPCDLAPVFNAILEKAHDLCGAETGVLLSYDGECYWPLAAHGTSARFIERARQGFRPGVNNPFARVLRGERFVQIPDVAEFVEGIDDPDLLIAVEMGIRTFVVVPLRKDDRFIGAISANRRTVRPLTDKQISLLQSFATQAVIAMENARLLGELRELTSDLQESLEYQTAISDVLKVISRSTFDLQPVLDTLCETAARLCDASTTRIALQRDDSYRYVSSFVERAISPEWDAMVREMPFMAGRG